MLKRVSELVDTSGLIGYLLHGGHVPDETIDRPGQGPPQHSRGNTSDEDTSDGHSSDGDLVDEIGKRVAELS